MAEYSDFLYYKDKAISVAPNPSPATEVSPEHAPIRITLPPLKRTQSPPSATSPAFYFQAKNLYTQHANELACSPPSKLYASEQLIELQPVLEQKDNAPVAKSDPQMMLKRCQNCGQYYKEKDNIVDKLGNAPCRYHPGKYQTVRIEIKYWASVLKRI